jgi:hypothetical protein
MYYPKFEAWVGMVGVLCWGLLFWLLGVVVLVHAYAEWLWFAAKPDANWHGAVWPAALTLLAFILVIQGGRGTYLIIAVMRGTTTMRLARRDFWSVLPNLVVFLKTGVWRQ